MKLLNETVIKVSPGERIVLEGDAQFDLTGTLPSSGNPLRIAASRTLEFVVPRTSAGTVLMMRAIAANVPFINLRSSKGDRFRLHVDPDSLMTAFQFVVEPQPDEWYCENDDGTPPSPHPVSKGDVTCRQCGGRVFHG